MCANDLHVWFSKAHTEKLYTFLWDMIQRHAVTWVEPMFLLSRKLDFGFFSFLDCFCFFLWFPITLEIGWLSQGSFVFTQFLFDLVLVGHIFYILKINLWLVIVDYFFLIKKTIKLCLTTEGSGIYLRLLLVFLVTV